MPDGGGGPRAAAYLGKGVGPRIAARDGEEGDEGLVEDAEVLWIRLSTRTGGRSKAAAAVRCDAADQQTGSVRRRNGCGAGAASANCILAPQVMIRGTDGGRGGAYLEKAMKTNWAKSETKTQTRRGQPR